MIAIFYVFYFVICFSYCMDVVPERPSLDYYNKKYISDMKLLIRKVNRTSPHYIDLYITTLDGVGNNLTVSIKLLELLSGRYQPTPLEASYKLCDFLYNEPFLGQMYAKQFPANWTCPFPVGTYHFKNLVIHLENFPFNIPFTWASYIVYTRTDVQGYRTDTKEIIFSFKCYVKVFQKPKNKIG